MKPFRFEARNQIRGHAHAPSAIRAREREEWSASSAPPVRARFAGPASSAMESGRRDGGLVDRFSNAIHARTRALANARDSLKFLKRKAKQENL